jgi:hypothetical protein
VRVHRRALLVVPATITLALAASCNRTREPDRGGDPSPVSSADPSAPKSALQPAEVTYQTPPAWSAAENPSPMRKATFRIPRAAGDEEDGELSVSQAGGSIDQNLQRWAGQFGHRLEDVKRDHQSPSGLRVTVVQIHGPYKGMAMPGAPAPGTKPGYALLGAIVETAPPTFFKLTAANRPSAGRSPR